MDRKVLIIATVAIAAILCASVSVILQLSDPGDDDDDLTIKVTGIYKNGTYNNVTIAPSVGDGTVTLSGMTIKGNLYIKGGGSNSVILENSTVEGTTTINKTGGEPPRLVADNSETGNVVLESDAILESKNDSAYGTVSVFDSNLTVQGNETVIENVQLEGEVGLDYNGGRIDSVTVGESVNVTTNTPDSVEALPFQTSDPEGPTEVNVNDKPVGVVTVPSTPEPSPHTHLFTYEAKWPAIPGDIVTVKGSCSCDSVAIHKYKPTETSRDVFCDQEGSATYSIEHNGTTYEHTYVLEEIGHNYVMTAQWSNDHSECGMTFTCNNDKQHVLVVDATVTTSIVSEHSCTEDGVTVYTATYELDGKEYTDTYTETVPKHTFSDVIYRWNQDYSSVVATITCDECQHSYEEQGSIDNPLTMDATCTTDGSRTYHATFATLGQDTVVQIIPKTGHDYVADFIWSNDLSKAEVTLICSNDQDHKYVDIVDSDMQSTPATCETDGVNRYTVSLEYDGKSYTAVKDDPIPKLGHDYEVEFRWDGHTATYIATCANDNTHELGGNAVVTHTDILEDGCTSGGTRTYTATATVDGQPYTNTKDEVIEPTEHEYGVTTYMWNTDHTIVMATKECSKCNDKVSEEGVISSETTAEPSYDATGNIRYTATFNGFDPTYKDVEIPKLVSPDMFTVKVYGGTVSKYGEAPNGSQITVPKDTVVTIAPTDTVLYWSDSAGDHIPGTSFDLLVTCDVYVTAHYSNETAYGGWVTERNPTCTEDGLRYRENPDTNHRIYEWIPSPGHDLGELHVVTDASCISEGNGYRECSECDEHITESIPKKGHNYDDGTVRTPAIGPNEGTMVYECTECGHERTKPYIVATIPSGDMVIDYRWVMAGSQTPDSTCRYETHTTWTIVGPDEEEHRAYLYYINKNVTDNSGDYRTDVGVMSWFLWVDYGDHSPIYVARTESGTMNPSYGDNDASECNWGLIGYADDMGGFIDFIDGLNVGEDNGRHASTLFDMYYAYVNAYNLHGPDHFTEDGTQTIAGRLCTNYYDDDWYYVVDENNCCLKLVSTAPDNTATDIDHRKYRYNQYIKLDTTSPEPFSQDYMSGSIFNRLPTLETITHLYVTFIDHETYHSDDFYHFNGSTFYYNVESEDKVFDWVIPENRYGYRFIGLQVKDLDGRWVDIPYAKYTHSGNPDPEGYGFDLEGYDNTLKGLYGYMCVHPELGRFVSPHDPGFNGVFLRCVYAPAETDAHIQLEGATFLDPADDQYKSEGDVYSGYEYTIQATVPKGKYFDEWIVNTNGQIITDLVGDATSEITYLTVPKGDISLSATFGNIPSYTVTVNTTGRGSVIGPLSGTYYEHDYLEWIAVPEQGFVFYGWYLNRNGMVVDEDDPFKEYGVGCGDWIEFSLGVNKDTTVTAVFIPFESVIDDHFVVSVVNGFAYDSDKKVYISKIFSEFNGVIHLTEDPNKKTVLAWEVRDSNGDPMGYSPLIPDDTDYIYVEDDTNVVGLMDVEEYTIIYDTNGGSPVESDTFLEIEDAMVSGTVPTKEGYNFLGWNTKSDGSGTDYYSESVIELTDDITLYAQWEKKIMKIALRCNNAINDKIYEVLYVEYDGTVDIPANAITVYGCVLKGWTYSLNGEPVEIGVCGTVPYGIDEEDGSYYVDAIVGDYCEYTVHFDSGYENPENRMDDVVFITTDLWNGAIRFNNTLTRSFYEFVSWSCDSDKVHTTDGSATVLSLIKTEEYRNGGEITLTATWKPLTYTIKYVKCDPIEGGTATGFGSSMTIQPYKNVTLQFYNVECTNHTLVGYSPIQKDTKAKYTYNQKVNANDLLIELSFDKDRTTILYPVWAATYYTIGYNGSNTTHDAIYNRNEVLDKFSTLGIEVPDGKVFAGWCTDAGCGSIDFTDGQNVKNITTIGSITLYPVFVDSTYTVHFFPEQGSNDHVEQVIQYGVETALMANTFVMDGKVFSCWTTNSNSMKTYDDKEVVLNLTTDGHISLYAVWEDANVP
ncbi:InlB B-repeat-containing protein [Methanomethylophilus alvi]|uniref:InlB B-repeat-containing protein n=1 Tax=Methanomethylophilus alvi TaxID=1291540 RepID=UPI0037DC028B